MSVKISWTKPKPIPVIRIDDLIAEYVKPKQPEKHVTFDPAQIEGHKRTYTKGWINLKGWHINSIDFEITSIKIRNYVIIMPETSQKVYDEGRKIWNKYVAGCVNFSPVSFSKSGKPILDRTLRSYGFRLYPM